MVGHVTSGDGITVNWIMAYVLFCLPFVVLLLSSLIVKVWVVRLYAGTACFSVFIGALLIITKSSTYILPTLASVFMIFSVSSLIVSVIFLGFKCFLKSNEIT